MVTPLLQSDMYSPTKLREKINKNNSELSVTLKAYIDFKAAEAASGKITMVAVNALPAVAEASANVIYLVPNTKVSGGNVKDEYILMDGAFELIGTTQIDLDGKADKAVPADAGNLAALDANGNLIDGGAKSQFAAASHRHTISEVTGLSDALAAKQNASDNSLNTTNKTVVGAVNEVHDELNGLVHAFTIDFQDTREIVQMHTFVGQKLTHIKTSNVSTLRLSINGSQQTIQLTNGEWTGEITVASGALLVWQIGRTSEGSIAEISVQYQYNS